MKIIKARPPNFAAILAAFPMASNANVIFAFHDAIYSPFVREIPPEIIAHEQVHLDRQGGTFEGAEAWWNQYINDLHFRFVEELASHRAEYKALIKNFPSRQLRRSALRAVAKKLASPLYGRMVTEKIAQSLIQGETDYE